MLILEANHIKKYFGERLILACDQIKIYSDDKIGIVGRNGSGKTTLLNLLSGELEADEGSIKRYGSISYIHQFSDENAAAHSKALKEFKVVDASSRVKRSGGEQTRIMLANAISKEYALLFADEPTTNLDFEGIELLLQKLSAVESLLLISHDRSLLDRLCNKIIEIDSGKLTTYGGSYSAYKEQKEMALSRAQFEYDQYAQEKTRLERTLLDRSDRAQKMKKAPARMGNSEARLHKRKATEKEEKIHNSASSIKTRLEKLDVKEKPRKQSSVLMDFSLTKPPENKIILSAQDLSFGYGSRLLFEHTRFEIFNGKKTAFIGENGSGKTTLLNLIYKGTSGISIVPKAIFGYFYQGLENLHSDETVLKNVMLESIQNETTARTILARLLIKGDDVFKRVGVLSGGERIKVSFAKLLVSNANVLLLDEPTNFLDMDSIESLQDLLCEYEGTVLFVSHDRQFVNQVADRLLLLQNRQLIPYEGNLASYEAHILQRSQKDDTQISILKMRLAETVSKMSMPQADKEALEEVYQDILRQLKAGI